MGKYYRERGKAVKEGKAPSREQEAQHKTDELFQRIQGAQIMMRKYGCPLCGKGPVGLQSLKTPAGARVPKEPVYHCQACGKRGTLQDIITFGAAKVAAEVQQVQDTIQANEAMKPNDDLPTKNEIMVDTTKRKVSSEEFAKAIGGEKMTDAEAAEWKKRHGVAP